MLSHSPTIVDVIKPENFEAIRFKDDVPLRDKKLWSQNLDRVKWLMDRCTVEAACDNDYAENIPSNYQYGATQIEFFPHWGSYIVGGINLKLPDSERQLHSDLETINKLEVLKVDTMNQLADRVSKR